MFSVGFPLCVFHVFLSFWCEITHHNLLRHVTHMTIHQCISVMCSICSWSVSLSARITCASTLMTSMPPHGSSRAEKSPCAPRTLHECFPHVSTCFPVFSCVFSCVPLVFLLFSFVVLCFLLFSFVFFCFPLLFCVFCCFLCVFFGFPLFSFVFIVLSFLVLCFPCVFLGFPFVFPLFFSLFSFCFPFVFLFLLLLSCVFSCFSSFFGYPLFFCIPLFSCVFFLLLSCVFFCQKSQKKLENARTARPARKARKAFVRSTLKNSEENQLIELYGKQRGSALTDVEMSCVPKWVPPSRSPSAVIFDANRFTDYRRYPSLNYFVRQSLMCRKRIVLFSHLCCSFFPSSKSIAILQDLELGKKRSRAQIGAQRGVENALQHEPRTAMSDGILSPFFFELRFLV